MEQAKSTPKDFFLWAGAMVALYAGVFSFVSLMFEYIDHVFPDTALGYYDPYASGTAYAMASLIVLAPTFLVLMRIIRRAIQADPSRGEVWVRRWALFLTLFVAGATVVIDLIVLLYSFFRGDELTIAFLLKVLVVLLVASAGFMHFIADLWGYWARRPQYARYINWATGALVVLTIASGFLIVGTPQQQRMRQIDQTRLQGVQQLQSQILNYYQLKQKLPTTLNDVEQSLTYESLPVDPETHKPYEYTVKGALQFELCADFDTNSAETNASMARPVMPYGGINEKWEHGIGRTCFTRTIDPDLYAPYPTKGL